MTPGENIEYLCPLSSLPQAVLGQDEEHFLPPGEEAGGLVPDQAGKERPGQTGQIGPSPSVRCLRLRRIIRLNIIMS